MSAALLYKQAAPVKCECRARAIGALSRSQAATESSSSSIIWAEFDVKKTPSLTLPVSLARLLANYFQFSILPISFVIQIE